MRIFGIDFTSSPSTSKPITQAECELRGDTLYVCLIRALPDFTSFEAALRVSGPWVTALDFPFGQPRKLIENLGWPGSWPEYVRMVGAMTKSEFETLLRNYQANRPNGDKRHFRAVDEKAGSCSPMQLDFIPVAKMFFEGSPRLLRSTANIVPLRWQSDSAGTVLEGYPALVARRWIERSKYKSDDRNNWTAQMKENRRTLVAAIQASEMKPVYGFRVAFENGLDNQCIEDGTGDRLDAILCAVQAGWAHLNRAKNYGIPATCDSLLEGWIADPKLANG